MIIPSYNHQQFIIEAIASVSQQDYRPIEVLLIDDGSTDQTYELGLNYLRKSSIPFLAIKKDNQGSCVSGINLGIQRCNGIYVSILASDDIYLPKKLSLSIKAIVEQNADLALAQVVRMHADGTFINNSETSLDNVDRSYRYGTLLQDIISPKSVRELPYLGMVWRRSTFNMIGLFDPAIFTEDYDMAIRIAKARLEIAFVYNHVAVHRIIAKSKNYNIRVSEAAESVLMKHKSDLGKEGRAALAYARANRGISLRSSQPHKSLLLLLYALVKYPPVSLYLLRCISCWLRKQSESGASLV